MDLLRLLADGNLHSGVELAGKLGVGRMTISNQVADWKRRGLTIEAIGGRGYRLARPLDLLDLEVLQEAVESLPCGSPLIELHDRVGSTNDRAQEQLGAGVKKVICFAEDQVSGRGRRGRSWYGLPGAGIAVSFGWAYGVGMQAFQGLSLAIGVAVAEVVRESGLEVRLKWPNDLVTDKGKLGGILIEATGDLEGPCHVVVGIGLNVSLPPEAAGRVDQEVTDIQSEGGVAARNVLASRLIRAVAPLLDNYPDAGFAPWRQHWESLDAYRGREVVLFGGAEVVEGLAAGVNEHGALQIRTPEGVRSFYGGELSLRCIR